MNFFSFNHSLTYSSLFEHRLIYFFNFSLLHHSVIHSPIHPSSTPSILHLLFTFHPFSIYSPSILYPSSIHPSSTLYPSFSALSPFIYLLFFLIPSLSYPSHHPTHSIIPPIPSSHPSTHPILPPIPIIPSSHPSNHPLSRQPIHPIIHLSIIPFWI